MNLCVLYDTQSIVESYECNEFAEYAPGYISIGNDNGDRELIIKAEKGAVLCGFLDAAEIGSYYSFKRINPNSKEDMKLLREVLRNNYFDDEDE